MYVMNNLCVLNWVKQAMKNNNKTILEILNEYKGYGFNSFNDILGRNYFNVIDDIVFVNYNGTSLFNFNKNHVIIQCSGTLDNLSITFIDLLKCEP